MEVDEGAHLPAAADEPGHEFGLGLVNRYAERLNVFSLSLALKAWLAVLVIALILVALVDHVLGWIAGQHNLLDLLGQTIFPAA